MAIKFNELAEKEYYTLRQEILSAIEGSCNEVYRDSKGIATIGIGLNLRNKAPCWSRSDYLQQFSMPYL